MYSKYIATYHSLRINQKNYNFVNFIIAQYACPSSIQGFIFIKTKNLNIGIYIIYKIKSI